MLNAFRHLMKDHDVGGAAVADAVGVLNAFRHLMKDHPPSALLVFARTRVLNAFRHLMKDHVTVWAMASQKSACSTPFGI